MLIFSHSYPWNKCLTHSIAVEKLAVKYGMRGANLIGALWAKHYSASIHEILGGVNRLFGGYIFSDFIPLLPCKSYKLRIVKPDQIWIKPEDLPEILGFYIDLFTEYVLFEEQNDDRDQIIENNIKVVDFSSDINLFKIIIESKYRPDVVCMYFHEVGDWEIVLEKKRNRFGEEADIKEINVKVVKPYKVYIVEVKSSNPFNDSSYTISQKKFIEAFKREKQKYGDKYEFIVVYIPFGETLNRLWYEVYVSNS